MKAAAEHALNALDAILELAGDAAGDAGVPGLSGALAAARVLLQKIQVRLRIFESYWRRLIRAL